MVVLRDMIPSDIEDYVRWFTTETEWGGDGMGRAVGMGGNDRGSGMAKLDGIL